MKSNTALLAFVACLFVGAAVGAGESAPLKPSQPGVVSAEFIFEKAPFPSCHASTIAESGDALIAAWFGGTREGHADVGIWLSRRERGQWTPPIEVANGVQSPTRRLPCWNPVLFQPTAGPLLLFYKAGPSPSAWWGMMTTSPDHGKTWSAPLRLPAGILGPIKNKPVQLAGGDLLCPSSTETSGWRVHFERSPDLGKTWNVVAPPESRSSGARIDAIQPSILFHGQGELQALGRTRSGRIFETWSKDGGLTWSALALTSLPNPNSGIDAVTLKDGRQVLIYNHDAKRGRSPLNLAVSRDGKNWEAGLVLEDEPRAEFSYPAVIQARDGLIHTTYTWKRQRIKHVVVDPALLVTRPMPGGEWPR